MALNSHHHAAPSTPATHASTSTIDDSRPVSSGFDALGTTLMSDAFAFDDHLSDVDGAALARHDSPAAIRNTLGSASRSSSPPHTAPSTPSASQPRSGSRSPQPRLNAPTSLDRLRDPSTDTAWTPPKSITSQARLGTRVTSWTAAAAALGDRPPDSISQNSVSNRLKELHSGQFGRALSPRPTERPWLSPLTTQGSPGTAGAPSSPLGLSSSPRSHSPSPASAPAAHGRPSAADILAQPGEGAVHHQSAPRSAAAAPLSAFGPTPRATAGPQPYGDTGLPLTHSHTGAQTQTTITPVHPTLMEPLSPLVVPKRLAELELSPKPDEALDHPDGLGAQPARQKSASYTSPPMFHRPIPSVPVSGLGISFAPAPGTEGREQDALPNGQPASDSASSASVHSFIKAGLDGSGEPEVIVESGAERQLEHGHGHDRTTSTSTATAARSTSGRHLRNRSSRHESENRLSIGGRSHASGAGSKRASRFSQRFSFFGGGDKAALGRTGTARKSLNRASVMLRRSLGRLVPGLDPAPVQGEAGQGLSHESSANQLGASPSGPMQMANFVSTGPAPYAAHMQPPGSGPIDTHATENPRAQWSEWNLAPAAPGARFWHRFSLAVQHEPEWAPDQGAQSPRDRTVAWLSAEKRRRKQFKIALLVTFVLLACIIIAASVGGSLAGRHSHSS